MDFLTGIGKTLVTGAIALSAFLGFSNSAEAPAQPQTFGNFNPTGGTTYRLASSIGITDTTIRLSSFKEPVSNIPYTMAYINTSVVYGTLDPQTTRSEFVAFTGITQNANGTASLTGVIRGLTRTPGASSCTVASSTLKQSHSGQSVFILSDSPCLFNQYAVKSNDETITGQWTFSTFPITPASPAASETTAGISELATGAEAAAGTLSGATTFRLVLPTSISTSTWNSATAGNVIPVTDLSTKKIADNFISTSTLLAATSTINIGAFPAWQIGKQKQIFTSTGTTTFSVPSGITSVVIEVQGGGGGGAGGNGSGGGGGGYCTEIINVSGTSTIQLFVGSGGAAGTANGAGSTGTWSTFGTNGFYCLANPGVGGIVNGNSMSGSPGGTATGGDINISGGAADAGFTVSTLGVGGRGGDSIMGHGGAATSRQTSGIIGGVAGTVYGGGGSAGAATSGSTDGGPGAQGIVIVRW